MNCSIELNGGDISKATASGADCADTAAVATLKPINAGQRLFIAHPLSMVNSRVNGREIAP
jgi:hypothetical protein